MTTFSEMTFRQQAEELVLKYDGVSVDQLEAMIESALSSAFAEGEKAAREKAIEECATVMRNLKAKNPARYTDLDSYTNGYCQAANQGEDEIRALLVESDKGEGKV